MMTRPTIVEPRDGYRIWLRYSDGAAGEVDLSHLAGRGVFAAWNDPACFEAVRVTADGGIAWGENEVERVGHVVAKGEERACEN